MERREPPGLEAWRAADWREIGRDMAARGRPDLALQCAAMATHIERQRAQFFFAFMSAPEPPH